MAKLTLNNITVGFASNSLINANNDLIEAALENTLSRDGTGPNYMEADLDMNSNKISNLAAPEAGSDAVRLVDIQNGVAFPESAIPSLTGNSYKVLGSTNGAIAWIYPNAWETSLGGPTVATELAAKAAKATANTFTATNTFSGAGTGFIASTSAQFDSTVNFLSSGQVRFQGAVYSYTGINDGIASGTDTYTVTIGPMSAHSEGMVLWVYFANANTITNPTLNLNSIGAATITRANGAALSIGDLEGYHSLIWRSTGWRVLNPNKVGHRGTLVYNSSSQVITTATSTALTWDSEAYDTDAIHDTGTNPERLVVPAGVTKVRLSAQVSFSYGATGYRLAEIRKNTGGTDNLPGRVYDSRLPITTASEDTHISLSGPVLEVTPGDYFTLYVYHTQGSDLNALQSTNYGCWFAMEIIE